MLKNEKFMFLSNFVLRGVKQKNREHKDFQLSSHNSVMKLKREFLKKKKKLMPFGKYLFHFF